MPLHDDRKLFEFLVLEGFQAGLSWRTILHKREAFREVFCNFDPARVALFNQEDVERLLQDARIIRNRLKVESIIRNARAWLAMQEQGAPAQRWWDWLEGCAAFRDLTRAAPAATSRSRPTSRRRSPAPGIAGRRTCRRGWSRAGSR